MPILNTLIQRHSIFLSTRYFPYIDVPNVSPPPRKQWLYNVTSADPRNVKYSNRANVQVTLHPCLAMIKTGSVSIEGRNKMCERKFRFSNRRVSNFFSRIGLEACDAWSRNSVSRRRGNDGGEKEREWPWERALVPRRKYRFISEQSQRILRTVYRPTSRR